MWNETPVNWNPRFINNGMLILAIFLPNRRTLPQKRVLIKKKRCMNSIINIFRILFLSIFLHLGFHSRTLTVHRTEAGSNGPILFASFPTTSSHIFRHLNLIYKWNNYPGFLIAYLLPCNCPADSRWNLSTSGN